MEITGIVKHILPTASGEGANGPWKRAEVVIEYMDGQYAKKVAVQGFNDKADALERMRVGDEVTVKFNVESREHNGKWYTSLSCWSAKSLSPEYSENMTGSGNAPAQRNGGPGKQDDLPF